MRYLIGVDSDGTAFDSMGRKHIEAFIPAALEIWPMPEEMGKRFADHEKKVNLFSELRGINRFPGLLEVFERMEKEAGASLLPDLEPLRAYIRGEKVYSPSTLRAWMAKHPSAELERVLAWSNRADALFARACQGLMPFPGVAEALRTAAAQGVCIAVISSAARSSLEKDWLQGGLTPYVTMLMSQEDGSKAEQLRKAMAALNEPVRALMIGDTRSDGEEAHSAGAAFYPILPGKEAASWARFSREILPLFLRNGYNQATEAEELAALTEILKDEE